MNPKRRRRSPYRHRVRAHKRKGKPVKTFLRGKGDPRQPRKYRHVDGWVRRKVVKRPPPIVDRRKALLDRLDVHKINLSNARMASGQARILETKVRYYEEYLGHAKLYNDTVTDINKLPGKKLTLMKPPSLQKMRAKWSIKRGWVRGLRAGDPHAPRAAKIIWEYDLLWQQMERKQRQEEKMTPAERRKSVYNRIDICKESIELSDKYNELTGTSLSAYGFKLFPKRVMVPGEITLQKMFTKEQLAEYKKYKRALKKK